MTMRNCTSLLLVAVLSIFLSGCGKNQDAGDSEVWDCALNNDCDSDGDDGDDGDDGGDTGDDKCVPVTCDYYSGENCVPVTCEESGADDVTLLRACFVIAEDLRESCWISLAGSDTDELHYFVDAFFEVDFEAEYDPFLECFDIFVMHQEVCIDPNAGSDVPPECSGPSYDYVDTCANIAYNVSLACEADVEEGDLEGDALEAAFDGCDDELVDAMRVCLDDADDAQEECIIDVVDADGDGYL